MVNIREKDRPKTGIYSNYRKSKGKPVLYMAVALLVILVMAVIYNPNREAKRMIQNRKNAPASTSSEPEFIKQGELTFIKADSTIIVKIDIEIADDDVRRERGLMYRRQMELNRGMLFIFEDEDVRSFWMKNTYLPLDIVYLSAQKKIVRIHENVAILNEMSIPSDFPAKYVVEVNAGFCALYNIQVGDGMTFVRR
ncbi:MAG: DUF192 domain-containing protein [Porphyromonadaceae bacterium]|nr:MAG: DUF192 domain-containing protein [Porphyromonadaceae bacterium]